MKRNRYILIGILAGIITGGGWLAWAAIQSQVGNNVFNQLTGVWNPHRQILNFVTDANGGRLPNSNGIAANAMIVGNPTTNTYAILSGAGTSGGTLGNNATNLGVPLASVTHLWTGSTWSQLYSAGIGGFNASGDNTAAVANYIFDNNSTVIQRGTSSANLTNATSTGVALTAPLSTWSITNTPASATQATSSKAANASLRHVATSITVCLASTAVGGNAPLNFNLRDGATGAGTILWTSIQTTAGIANGGTCTTLSGLAMIGTVNTAMTLESAAAPAANGTATVTLTGFSVS
jgi:hypothetical protein